ncbi:transcriptional regulator, GntR family [Quadrisphaera granulorum]|uniref:GntR family transcriptional regulator n=1 Tax=Quadrisphaera granulorum TaxID=317664 RepID=A0A316AEA9_9ACTN|nr:PLP-dependent aminotransferase family protein [Quadrisphaera granulorum]PWJ56115.1 GntR family transcriptional regulator [Quadrisphaera granulorum]SZE94749.1 transcriptional regulator, GntR family [Quadrisphaera granulorum]
MNSGPLITGPMGTVGPTTTSAERLAELIGADTLHAPMYASLASGIQGLVRDGRLGVGVRLPAERELAAALGVSRVTVSAAYGRLREAGWADARQGSGTWTQLPATSGVVAAWVPGGERDGTLDLSYAAPPGPPEVADAYAQALTELPRHLGGHGYTPLGLLALRTRIADRYTARGLPTTPEQVLVTCGAGGAVSAALRAVLDAGDRLVVEHPVWPNALDVARELRARLVPVSRDLDSGSGFVTAVHRAARQTSARALYVVPDFSNPTGATLSEGDRRSLVISMQQQEVTVVADEALADLALDDQESLTPLAAHGRPGTVLSAGSLSKAVWAGVRIGWLRAEPDVIARTAAAASRDHGALSLVDQLAACALLDVLDVVVARRRVQLRAQRDALVAALGEHLPEWGVTVPPGGQSLWCRLPAGVSSSVLVDTAEQLGLRLATGSRFGAGHAFDDMLRLPFTAPVPDLLRAVELLVAASSACAGRSPSTPRRHLV